MNRDVSLCVIRIETSGPEEDDNKLRRPGSLHQGQRKINEIRIETFLPEMSQEECSSFDDPSGGAAALMGGSDIEDKLAKGVIHFISGNPFVEITRGILHLFKEDDLTDIERASKKSQTICILSVPSTMTCSDLLQFMASCYSDIKHIRIIKDGSPSQYMALLTFRSQASVMQFYLTFNGAPFSSLEPEWSCHLVFVSKIEALSESEGGCIAPSNHTELPSCPVCLERMDESVDGILTILCNHAFHGQCLAKWGDTSCPVCRYVQTPEPCGESKCLECSATESLWICLICGHVGCGRYLQAHAYQHYLDTNHCYSMQLGSNSVWDYVGDNFVHRIIQNKADGKLVEGPNPDNKSSEVKAEIDAIQLEYTYLLTSQLESQRMYYEEQIAELERKSIDSSIWKEKAHNSLDELSQIKIEKVLLEKKLSSVMGRNAALQKQLDEEKLLNSALRKNQSEWKDKFKILEKEFEHFKATKNMELNDVKEQLRDVMFHLEAENTLNSQVTRRELSDARIEVPTASTSTSQKGRRKNSKKKT